MSWVCPSVCPSHSPMQTNKHKELKFGMEVKCKDNYVGQVRISRSKVRVSRSKNVSLCILMQGSEVCQHPQLSIHVQRNIFFQYFQDFQEYFKIFKISNSIKTIKTFKIFKIFKIFNIFKTFKIFIENLEHFLKVFWKFWKFLENLETLEEIVSLDITPAVKKYDCEAYDAGCTQSICGFMSIDPGTSGSQIKMDDLHVQNITVLAEKS